MTRCPSCGAAVGDDFSFCEQCGSEIPSQDQDSTCPSCDATVRADDQFCESCGTELSQNGGGPNSTSSSSNGGRSASSHAPDDALLVAEGSNGQVILFETKIRISRDDIGLHKINHLGSGDKEIRLENITSVQLKKPSTLTKGYIQFGQSGYSESDDGTLDAASDENSVLFAKDSLAQFVELRSEIERLRNQDQSSSSGGGTDPTEQLKNITELHEQGILTDEEFEEKKQSLLDEI